MFKVFISLAFLGICLERCATFESFESKEPKNGMYKGYVGRTEICQNSKFVTSFQMKSDGAMSRNSESGLFKDDQGATGLRFLCQDEPIGLTSSVGSKGQWYETQACPKNQKMVGIELNVKPGFDLFHRINDELGVEDLRMICQDGTTLNGLHGNATDELVQKREIVEAIMEESGTSNQYEVSVKTTNDNYWGPAAFCSPGFFICGLQTRLDSRGLFEDNAGLTNVIIICCM